MQRFLLITLAMFVLAGCGAQGGGQATAPTMAQATAMPLEQIDLEPLLVQDGDLPAGMTGGQIKDAAPAAFKDISGQVQVRDRRFAQGSEVRGGVVVWLFKDKAQRDASYTTIATKTYKNQDGLGERAAFASPDDLLGTGSVVFVRCAAVVEARLRAKGDDLLNYARRLDRRLQAAVC